MFSTLIKGVAGSGQHKRAMAMMFMTTVVFSSVIDAQARAGGADWEVFYSVISSCPMSACMFVFFIAFMQVALMSIFTGIFVEKAMKLAPPDANVLALEKRQEEIMCDRKIRELLRDLHISRTGKTSAQVLVEKCRSEKFQAQLAVLGLT